MSFSLPFAPFGHRLVMVEKGQMQHSYPFLNFLALLRLVNISYLFFGGGGKKQKKRCSASLSQIVNVGLRAHSTHTPAVEAAEVAVV